MDPDRNDDPRTDDSSRPKPTSDEPEDAGRRPGMHPDAKRSGTSRSTAITLAIVLVLAAVLYALIALGIAGSG